MGSTRLDLAPLNWTQRHGIIITTFEQLFTYSSIQLLYCVAFCHKPYIIWSHCHIYPPELRFAHVPLTDNLIYPTTPFPINSDNMLISTFSPTFAFTSHLFVTPSLPTHVVYRDRPIQPNLHSVANENEVSLSRDIHYAQKTRLRSRCAYIIIVSLSLETTFVEPSTGASNGRHGYDAPQPPD